MRTGIIAAATGKTINDPLTYDSTLSHLLIDTRPTAQKHIDLMNIKGGTALVSSANIGPVTEELLSIQHGLTYVPRVTATFFVHDAPVVLIVGRNPIGTFSTNTLNMNAISIGVPVEYLYISVNETYFKVIHYFSYANASDHTATATATGPSWSIDLKYMINNNSRKYPYTSSLTG